MAKKSKGRPSPPERSPEPEGGPLERQRAFLEERMTPLKPKSEAPPARRPERTPAKDEPPRRRGGVVEESTLEGVIEEAPLPNRKRVIEQYRKRQQKNGTAAPHLEAVPLPPPANNWIPIGPSVVRQGQGGVMPAVSGRTPAIAPIAGGSRCYIGAANGGVWRSEDGGASWVSLMDAFDLNPTHLSSDSLAVGALAVVAGPSAAQDRIYVGSGEGAGGAYFGVGPIVSLDGGQNWVTEPVAPGSPELAGSAFYALAVDPADPDRVVGATRQGLFRREPNGAGGFHWARKTPPNPGSDWATSVVVARAGGVTTFYAAFWGGPVYASIDGDSWTVAGTGFPAVGRVALGVRPDNANIVYAFTEQGTVHRLDIAAGNWRQVNGLPAPGNLVGSQGWYDLAMAVAPDNANRIYLGGSIVFSGGDWSGAVYRCEITVTAANVTATSTYIGNSVHADIHAIVFTPGSASQMWVGCDGGVYRTDNATGSSPTLFTSKNKGLQTLTQNYLGQHPTEDAVVFSGTQDNGGERFTGEEAWLYTSGGDSGYFVVNWNDPYRVVDTYVRGAVRRSTTGGTRYSYSDVPVPLVGGDNALFYAPLAGTPINPGAPADADVIAFGSVRPWISTNFGTSWQSIPNNTLAGDELDGSIKCLTFASATKLYAGTMAGGVYRFTKSGANWTRSKLDTMGGANQLPLSGVVTAIAIDLADGTGNSIYITFGGSGDYRHVWHFNGTQWQQRSGSAAGAADALLDVQHNAIVVDPANPTDVYVGADIGMWRSTDSGATWEVFSDGLPDAAVLDLKLHAPRRLLRASTHGRGCFERTLDTGPKQGVELYVRDTQLDQGRFATINFLPDPVNQGQNVAHWRGPDIKVDTPDINGDYQFPLTGQINFFDFVDTLHDDAGNVATHATATITTRVYVQVHNRGVVPANNVRVMCLLANASAGLPNLPAGYEADVQAGTAINNANWQTLGIATLDDVRVGFPKIAAFDLTSDKLPPPANLAGNHHFCVLALLHHADDPYTSSITNTDQNSIQKRKAAHKNLNVVQFTGTTPQGRPAVMAFRVNAPDAKKRMLSDIRFELRGYPGRVRLFAPRFSLERDLAAITRGWRVTTATVGFKNWAKRQRTLIAESEKSKTPYNKVWARQRLDDIAKAEKGLALVATLRQGVRLRRVVLEPDKYHTFFLLLDRPPDGQEGDNYEITIIQRNSEDGAIQGGLDLRVELLASAQTKMVGKVKRAVKRAGKRQPERPSLRA